MNIKNYRVDEDFKKLEERRSALINIINQIVEEQKRKRNEILNEASTMRKDEDDVSVEEVKTFKEFDSMIQTIAHLSGTQAWVADISGSNDIKLLSLQSVNTKCMTLQNYNDFIALGNGDFIVTNYTNQVIGRVSPHGTESVIVNTKPVHPTYISKTQTGDVLVSLRDDGDDWYRLLPSSRRLVQRITLTGKVLHTYEYREDRTTRLFTLPGNISICMFVPSITQMLW